MLTIDPATGAITWGGCRLHPAMTEEDLLRLNLTPMKLGGARLRERVTHTHYTLPRVPVDGGHATLTAFFANGGLTEVALVFALDGDSPDWSTWSAERERRRQWAHDAYLDALLGAPDTLASLATSGLEDRPFTHRAYHRPWGELGSTYDDQLHAATLYVRYT